MNAFKRAWVVWVAILSMATAAYADEEQSFVTGEASIAFDSKFLTYGLIDGDNPIMTPRASLNFADWFFFGVESLFDLSDYGKRAGYSNRSGCYQELDMIAGLSHCFSEDDLPWLGTALEFSLVYFYEYHPRSMVGDAGEDTAFVILDLALPDLWLEPALEIERDIDRDNGTYVALELGHSFTLVDGEAGDDPTLVLRPSVSQGFGDRQRVRGYLCSDWDSGEPLDHAGLMDTMLKLELIWSVVDGIDISGYVAYSDFLFDRSIRESSRGYEASGRYDESYNFIGGLAVTLAF